MTAGLGEGTRWYGNTNQGEFMSEAEAQARGYRAAKNGQVEVSKPVRTSPFCSSESANRNSSRPAGNWHTGKWSNRPSAGMSPADAFLKKCSELPLDAVELGSLDSLVDYIRAGFWKYQPDEAVLILDDGLRVRILSDGRFLPIES
jgi:hypothetical protein